MGPAPLAFKAAEALQIDRAPFDTRLWRALRVRIVGSRHAQT